MENTVYALKKSGKQKAREFFVKLFFMFNGYIALLFLLLIFIFIFQEALQALFSINLNDLFFTQKILPNGEQIRVFEWYPTSDNPRYSLVPLILGSLLTALPATLIATVIGVMVGIYLSEIAGDKLREVIKPVVELFAGIPTVVMGFFIVFVAATFFKDMFGFISRLNAFIAALGLSVIIIPIIASITEDVMRAVPRELRMASFALGASKWQTITRVIIPTSIKGISAGILIAFGRAFGETMIVLMATGNAAVFDVDFFGSVRTLTATIAAEMGEMVVSDVTHYHILFLIGLILFISTFILNLIASLILGKITKKLRH